jgi:hypothetical protein
MSKPLIGDIAYGVIVLFLGYLAYLFRDNTLQYLPIMTVIAFLMVVRLIGWLGDHGHL